MPFADSGWKREAKSGLQPKVYVMFHSTNSPEAAESILKSGFRNSKSGMLGEGVYVSKDFNKANAYGPVTFRLLVYPGKVCKIDKQGHEMQTTWQATHGSAWVPPKCGMVGSGREETCVKDKGQIRIIGICKGYNLLNNPSLTRDLDGRTGDTFHDDEMQLLKEFTAQLGLTQQREKLPEVLHSKPTLFEILVPAGICGIAFLYVCQPWWVVEYRIFSILLIHLCIGKIVIVLARKIYYKAVDFAVRAFNCIVKIVKIIMYTIAAIVIFVCFLGVFVDVKRANKEMRS